ncbi:ribokinase [Opitutus sp. ER46]|uniref:ribokinase n=1 Tax=Opitutus sp. ER46 TaxID=2161864 RepID=UPI000D31B19A|nr:ribokinase [Opitutus sp. ER46]PTX92302.1 ribokinase [Opitutus sp. ER46]
MSRARIAVIGSSNTDMILKLPRIPRPGETLLGGEYLSAAGGKGANQAVAAARLGGAVSFIARVGADVLGEQAIAGFQHEGIDVQHVQRDAACASGVALIFVDAQGENCIGVAGGANGRLSADDIARAHATIAGSAVALLQLETPLATVQAAAETAATAGATVILNPAPAQELPDALLRHISVLTPNEHEAALLSGLPVTDAASAATAAARLLAKGPKAVVITLGALGAYVHTASGGQLVPSFPVQAVDTTAAGDTFNGALAVALAEGRPLAEAVRFGNAAAALSVTRFGAQPSVPTRREVEAFLRG